MKKQECKSLSFEFEERTLHEETCKQYIPTKNAVQSLLILYCKSAYPVLSGDTSVSTFFDSKFMSTDS